MLQILGSLGVTEGASMLLLNSLPLDPDSASIYTMATMLRVEARTLAGLSAFGVPPARAANFLSFR